MGPILIYNKSISVFFSFSVSLSLSQNLTCLKIFKMEASFERIGAAKFRTDHHIVRRLVPVIVAKLHGLIAPCSFNVERLAIK